MEVASVGHTTIPVAGRPVMPRVDGTRQVVIPQINVLLLEPLEPLHLAHVERLAVMGLRRVTVEPKIIVLQHVQEELLVRRLRHVVPIRLRKRFLPELLVHRLESLVLLKSIGHLRIRGALADSRGDIIVWETQTVFN